MPREQFLYDGSQQLCDLLDEAGQRAGVSRGQAFEDFLCCTVCCLSNQQMEQEYLAVIGKGYAEGEQGPPRHRLADPGFRHADLADERDPQGHPGRSVPGRNHLRRSRPVPDVGRDLPAYGGPHVSTSRPTHGIVADPCCGSGRMLLAYADNHRPRALVGQDIDLRCVRMTASIWPCATCTGSFFGATVSLGRSSSATEPD